MAVSAGRPGAQGMIGIDTANPTTVGFEFLNETLAKQGVILGGDGIRGSRSHTSERTRTGPYVVAGSITLQPSPEEWALLLPWILGANASGTTFALAETLQSRYVQKRFDGDAGTKSVATYATVYVGRATIESSQGSPLTLTLELIGETETLGASFPALTPARISGPFMHQECVLTMLSATRLTRSVRITIDNALQPFFNNSTTMTQCDSQDRIITVQTEHPWNATNADLLDQALAGAAATLVYTYGAYSFAFTFATLQVPAETPKINARADVPLQLNMTARMLSTTKELVCTLDSTP